MKCKINKVFLQKQEIFEKKFTMRFLALRARNDNPKDNKMARLDAAPHYFNSCPVIPSGARNLSSYLCMNPQKSQISQTCTRAVRYKHLFFSKASTPQASARLC